MAVWLKTGFQWSNRNLNQCIYCISLRISSFSKSNWSCTHTESMLCWRLYLAQLWYFKFWSQKEKGDQETNNDRGINQTETRAVCFFGSEQLYKNDISTQHWFKQTSLNQRLVDVSTAQGVYSFKNMSSQSSPHNAVSNCKVFNKEL